MFAQWDKTSPASPLSVPAEQTAILLMDYHNLIVNLIPTGTATVGVAENLRKWAADKRFLVVHCLIDTSRDPAPNVHLSDTFRFFQKSFTEKPETGANALKELANEHTVYRIPGHLSALKSEGLQAMFEERGIKSVVLCGLATGGVVLRTASPTADAGYIVTIIEDACGDRTPERHKTIMEVIQNQTNQTTGAEFMEKWDAA